MVNALLRVVSFHELLYFRHLHTIRLSRGEGVRQRFSIKLTMPFANSVNLPHKYYGEHLACVARFFLFNNNKREKRQAERAGLVRDYEEIRLAGGEREMPEFYGVADIRRVAPAGLSTIGRWPGYDTVLAQVRSAALV